MFKVSRLTSSLAVRSNRLQHFVAMGTVAMGTGTLSEVYGELQRAVDATERLMELLHAKNEIVATEKPEDASRLTTSLALKMSPFITLLAPTKRLYLILIYAYPQAKSPR